MQKPAIKATQIIDTRDSSFTKDFNYIKTSKSQANKTTRNIRRIQPVKNVKIKRHRKGDSQDGYRSFLMTKKVNISCSSIRLTNDCTSKSTKM